MDKFSEIKPDQTTITSLIVSSFWKEEGIKNLQDEMMWLDAPSGILTPRRKIAQELIHGSELTETMNKHQQRFILDEKKKTPDNEGDNRLRVGGEDLQTLLTLQDNLISSLKSRIESQDSLSELKDELIHLLRDELERMKNKQQ